MKPSGSVRSSSSARSKILRSLRPLPERPLLLEQTDPSGFEQAVQSFTEAIAKDPGYARAYAGLADTYALMSAYDIGSSQRTHP